MIRGRVEFEGEEEKVWLSDGEERVVSRNGWIKEGRGEQNTWLINRGIEWRRRDVGNRESRGSCVEKESSEEIIVK